MNPTLDEVKKLADGIMGIPDDRPPWLRNMPSASDEGYTAYARYYRFFYEYVKAFRPKKVLEIGTYLGSSAIHFAYDNPGLIVTVDISKAAVEEALKFGLFNLIGIVGDSTAVVSEVARHGPFDVLFVDAVHDFEHCYSDYLSYRPMVAAGGIVFLDDIHMHEGMDKAWNRIDDPKVDLSILHYSGFGACKLDPLVLPKGLS